MAYIVTAIFLALSGTFFSTYLAGTDYSDTSIKGFLNAAQLLILLFAAVLTMRLVAEERKLGTWELLLTSPIKDAEIILGKFVGSLGILTLHAGAYTLLSNPVDDFWGSRSGINRNLLPWAPPIG